MTEQLKSVEQQALEILVRSKIDYEEVGRKFICEYPALFVMMYNDFHKVRDLVKVGKHVEAIKLYREVTGVGLREAKDYCDNVRSGL